MTYDQATSQFLDTNKNACLKWYEYLQQNEKDPRSLDVCNEITPLHETELFHKITREQQKALYYGFIKIIAESITFFESLLCASWHHNKKKFYADSDETLIKFTQEELLHASAFRKFIYSRSEISPGKSGSMLRGQKKMRKIMHAIAKYSPLSILIHGAKAETFTLFYSKLVMRYLPEDCPWRELNKMHYGDEIHHIPVGYEVYDFYVNRQSFILRQWTLILGILFTIGIQVMLFRSVQGMVSECFQEARFFRRMNISRLIMRWILFDFSPFGDTRKQLKRHYQKRKFRHYRILKMIHCGFTDAPS